MPKNKEKENVFKNASQMAAFRGDKWVVFLRSYRKDPNSKVGYVNVRDRDHDTKDFRGKSRKISQKTRFQKSWDALKGVGSGKKAYTFKFFFIQIFYPTPWGIG